MARTSAWDDLGRLRYGRALYVASVIVDDSNGRYYEAAPGRSWYAGAGLEYRFR